MFSSNQWSTLFLSFTLLLSVSARRARALYPRDLILVREDSSPSPSADSAEALSAALTSAISGPDDSESSSATDDGDSYSESSTSMATNDSYESATTTGMESVATGLSLSRSQVGVEATASLEMDNSSVVGATAAAATSTSASGAGIKTVQKLTGGVVGAGTVIWLMV